MINTVYILLGSNLLNKEQNLINAQNLISQNIGNIVKSSKNYYTEPWGFKSNNTFVNKVIILESKLPAFEILSITQKIEKQLGRKTKSVNQEYSDRIIDIDILFFNDEIINTDNLIIPHPQLHKRIFTLEPLYEVSPDFIHPVFKESISELLKKISLP